MAGAKIGLVLSRVIVPAWVLVGALFKLYEASPRLLPAKTILALADRAGVDLYVLLAVLIGLEFFAIAVMLFVARLARPMAIFVLSVFCLVLLAEMVQGNWSNCGCLGAHSPPPWVMMVIDGSLLFGVLVFDPSSVMNPNPPKWPIGLAAAVAVGGFGYSFYDIMDARPQGDRAVVAPPVPHDGGNPGGTTVPPGPVAAGVNPSPKPPPSWWFARDVEAWKGRPWRGVELFAYMTRWPKSLDTGTRYVIFYSRTCDHCETMFIEDLSDPALGRQVTAILVPGKNQRIPASAWDLPPGLECEMLELPFGPDWIITTPLTMRIVNGVVEDVVEGDHKGVMGLE